MAEKYDELNKLTLTWQFSDGDTRTMQLRGPTLPPDITIAQLKSNIKSYRDWVVANGILIGDQTGAPLADSDTAIKSAYFDYGTKTTLDLT